MITITITIMMYMESGYWGINLRILDLQRPTFSTLHSPSLLLCLLCVSVSLYVRECDEMVLREVMSVAPMLDVTTHGFRHLVRCLTAHTTLYTEMYVDQTVLHRRHDLHHAVGRCSDPSGRTVLQLGGSDPHTMAEAAKLLQTHMGYSHFNVNVGCPSGKVQKGSFGCTLMKHPARVGEVVLAMANATGSPVSVKCRLGVDHLESYGFLTDFIHEVTRRGAVRHVVVHARKAWLDGLSPKQNRNIPPLNYSKVYQLVTDFPHLTFTINGGIFSLPEMRGHLERVHSVMVGRQAEADPWMFTRVDAGLTPLPPLPQGVTNLPPVSLSFRW